MEFPKSETIKLCNFQNFQKAERQNCVIFRISKKRNDKIVYFSEFPKGGTTKLCTFQNFQKAKRKNCVFFRISKRRNRKIV